MVVVIQRPDLVHARNRAWRGQRCGVNKEDGKQLRPGLGWGSVAVRAWLVWLRETY
jgi:hypothetical protein